MTKRTTTYTTDDAHAPGTIQVYQCPMCHANTTSHQRIRACAYCGEPVGTKARGRITVVEPPPRSERVRPGEYALVIVTLLAMILLVIFYDMLATRISAAAVGVWAVLYLVYLCRRPTP